MYNRNFVWLCLAYLLIAFSLACTFCREYQAYQLRRALIQLAKSPRTP